MRPPHFLVRLVITVAVLLIAEYYSFQALSTVFKNSKGLAKTSVYAVYFILSVGLYLFFFSFPMIRTYEANKILKNAVIVLVVATFVAKVFMAAIMMIDDLRRIALYIISVAQTKNAASTEEVKTYISRSSFLSKLALATGGTIFGTILYGMNNRYNYKLRSINLPHLPIPDVFKKLRIIQISDVHSGSFTNKAAVQKGIDKIMETEPDIVFFTGDLVNNKSEEMTEYMDVFSQIKAPLGVYSVFGNHDYGDYIQWESDKAKTENLENLKSVHKQLGWNLLLNENRILNIEDKKLAIVGIENWGKGGFAKYGDLEKAYVGANEADFVILLSHDPSHWDAEVKNSDKKIHLTLSGHTHGMQFGIEIPGLKWSPAKFIYKNWAGLYSENEKYLYVNRGFGFLGYPGRVGILPEITEFSFA